MATFLMIESWVGAAGQALPARIVDGGHDYVLVTRDPGIYPTTGLGTPHPAVAHADEVVVAETNDPLALLTAASAIAARRPIDGVLTTCDYYLAATAEVAQHLGLPASPPEAMRTANRKDLVRRALSAADLPNARFAVARAWDETLVAAGQLGYPLVAKPVDLNAGSGVRLVHDDAGLKDAVAEIQSAATNTRGQALQQLVLLEEVLSGVEVSVETVTRSGTTTVLAVTDKSVAGAPAFVETGHMVPAALPAADTAAAAEMATAALAAVGLTHGLSHVEVMLTAEGPRVVEINPRQGGGHIFELVELVTGSHPLDLLIELALGNPLTSGTVGTVAAPSSRAAAPNAAVLFVLSPQAGTVVAVEGADHLDTDPGIIRWELPTPVTARPPVDNDAYLGHVIAVGDVVRTARERAESALARIRLVMADGQRLVPLGVPPVHEPEPGS
jgi:argininosuccinate lyase